jgi:hypothetical protein
MITATYSISGIRDQLQMMELSGHIAAWMMQSGREVTMLEHFAAFDEETGEPA